MLSWWIGAATLGFILLKTELRKITDGPTPDRNVSVESGELRDQEEPVPWVACSMRGWRPAMEDAHIVSMLDPAVFPDVGLFAVLDGHGGAEVSQLVSKLLCREVESLGRRQLAKGVPPSVNEALEQALPRLDSKLRRGPLWLGRLLRGASHPFAGVGSTACVAAVDFSKQEIVVANIGDSRAILVRDGKDIPLSEDHKPENPEEKERIENAGGRVERRGPCCRIDGNLNLSRAFGDFHLKANSALPADKQKVIAFPDMKVERYRSSPQELLVVGCDGLFEKKSNADIARLVWNGVKKNSSLEDIGKDVLRSCCATHPRELGTDNESVIIVKLPAREADASGYSHGQKLIVHGLNSEAGKALNGQVVTCEGPSDAGRFQVRTEDGTVKSLKAENLKNSEDCT
jgi:serine/threonine protein phosphatase PrpC